MHIITARDLLAIPSTSLPGAHADGCSASDCWAAVRALAAGDHTAAGMATGFEAVYATSTEWEGRRRVVAERCQVKS